jgi:membrane protein required for colicin V production
MVIDVIFALLMLMAIFRGFKKGLVLGIFSFIAFIIGLAAALKLSTVVAKSFSGNTGSLTKWMPLIAFLLVFCVVILLVSLGARLIKKTLQLAMLGWLDSLGGMILYICIYTIIFSIFLFYGERLMLIKHDSIDTSRIYPYVAPWGPKLIDNLGKIIPAFKDMFAELEDFFAGLAKKSQ